MITAPHKVLNRLSKQNLIFFALFFCYLWVWIAEIYFFNEIEKFFQTQNPQKVHRELARRTSTLKLFEVKENHSMWKSIKNEKKEEKKNRVWTKVSDI